MCVRERERKRVCVRERESKTGESRGRVGGRKRVR